MSTPSTAADNGPRPAGNAGAGATSFTTAGGAMGARFPRAGRRNRAGATGTVRRVRRVAEHSTGGRFRSKRLVRVDLHGVSTFGPGDEHTLIRWERIEDIVAGPGGVEVVTSTVRLSLPSGAFGLLPDVLAGQLRRAADPDDRGVVIDELAGAGGPG